MSEQAHIHVEDQGGITIVEFEDKKIIDELIIQELGRELLDLVNQGCKKIVLNFDNVEFLSSAALGKLILLDKKSKEVDGVVKLCEIRSEIHTAFRITRLDEKFDILPTLKDAIDAFAE